MKQKQFETFITALPEIPDIYGREEYLNTSVLVPFFKKDGEYHLLFQKRAEGISQASEICFPGGHYEEGVDLSFRDTAIRETVEELGITVSDITVLGRLDLLVTPRGVIVEPYVGLLQIDSLNDLAPDRGEVEEVFSLPLNWFLENEPEIHHSRTQIQSSYIDKDGIEQILLPVDELGLPQHYKGTRGGWMFKVIVYKTEKYVIWGLTASIIFGMLKKIKGSLERVSS